MDFQQLKIFLNVAALKSFSRTAELMFISQPAVSVRIKGLEEELGVVLFDRSRSRELTLTEAGRTFLDYAQQMVNLKEEALEQLAQEEGVAEGLVHVGASSVPGIYLLPSKLVKLRELYPSISISLSILDSARVLEKVLNYCVDLGFVGSLLQDERLCYYEFASDELILIAPPGQFGPAPFDDKPDEFAEISLETCLSGNLIIREKGSATRALFETVLVQNRISLHDFAALTFVDSLEAIKQNVRSGLGISLVSRHTAEDYLQMGLVDGYRLAGLDLTRKIYLVCHTGRVLSRAAKLALDIFTVEPIRK
jgi:LysR family transcriptional regulator, transcriptional activator of the cysJI operon